MLIIGQQLCRKAVRGVGGKQKNKKKLVISCSAPCRGWGNTRWRHLFERLMKAYKHVAGRPLWNSIWWSEQAKVLVMTQYQRIYTTTKRRTSGLTCTVVTVDKRWVMMQHMRLCCTYSAPPRNSSPNVAQRHIYRHFFCMCVWSLAHSHVFVPDASAYYCVTGSSNASPESLLGVWTMESLYILSCATIVKCQMALCAFCLCKRKCVCSLFNNKKKKKRKNKTPKKALCVTTACLAPSCFRGEGKMGRIMVCPKAEEGGGVGFSKNLYVSNKRKWLHD